jgi:hypothetical protein
LDYITLIVSFKKFYKRHFSVNLEKFIIAELDKLGITEKVISITTDSGADIKKAASNLGNNILRFSCTAHNINLVVQKSFCMWKIIRKLDNEISNSSNETEYFDESDEDMEYSDDENRVDDNVVGDIEDEFFENSDEFDEEINEDYESECNESDLSNLNHYEAIISQILKKVRGFVKIYKKSSIIFGYIRNYMNKTKKQNGKQKGLALDFHVRWNSTYDMIHRFKIYEEPIKLLTSKPESINGLEKMIYKLKK